MTRPRAPSGPIETAKGCRFRRDHWVCAEVREGFELLSVPNYCPGCAATVRVNICNQEAQS